MPCLRIRAARLVCNMAIPFCLKDEWSRASLTCGPITTRSPSAGRLLSVRLAAFFTAALLPRCASPAALSRHSHGSLSAGCPNSLVPPGPSTGSVRRRASASLWGRRRLRNGDGAAEWWWAFHGLEDGFPLLTRTPILRTMPPPQSPWEISLLWSSPKRRGCEAICQIHGDVRPTLRRST